MVIVESGWGSILPTVILASMLNSGPAARSGKLSVGDQIMSINDTSLVGLPLATCQGIIKVMGKNMCKLLCNFHKKNMLFVSVPGSEESGQSKAEYCELPTSHHCPHQET